MPGPQDSGRTPYKFALDLLEKAGVMVAAGVDLGQAGKRAARFSYASSEENTPKSWEDSVPAPSH